MTNIMDIKPINPEGMPRNPAFAQAMMVEGPAKMLYVGGQNGIRADGSMAGDDVGSQTEQALRNLLTVLAAVGARQENVVKMQIYLVQGQPVAQGFAAAQKVWGPHATAISVLQVAGLANPRFLVEIDAVAAVPA